ncbi:hypothetical protein SNEBB_003580 [Seison nebaliae]|nr:hypothetical protein SNEBB_003580 [Seison nebaliae]
MFRENVIPDLNQLMNYQVSETNMKSNFYGSIKRHFYTNFVSSPFYQAAINVAIIINTIFVCLQMDNKTRNEYMFEIHVVLQFFNGVFLVDILLRYINDKDVFFMTFFNKIDMIITVSTSVALHVGTGRLALFLSLTSSGKILRINYKFQPVVDIIVSLSYSSNDIFNIVLLMFVTMINFALFGGVMFRNEAVSWFHDFTTSFYTVFVCTNQQGWGYIEHTFRQGSNTYYVFAMVYCVVVIFVMAFISINLFVAVVIANVDASSNMHMKQKLKLVQKIEQSGHSPLGIQDILKDQKKTYQEKFSIKPIPRDYCHRAARNFRRTLRRSESFLIFRLQNTGRDGSDNFSLPLHKQQQPREFGTNLAIPSEKNLMKYLLLVNALNTNSNELDDLIQDLESIFVLLDQGSMASSHTVDSVHSLPLASNHLTRQGDALSMLVYLEKELKNKAASFML